MRAHRIGERRAALQVDDDHRLLTGRGLDEQLQEGRFPRARTAEQRAAVCQLALSQIDRGKSGAVSDTHAVAAMADATSSTPSGHPARSTYSARPRRRAR